MINSELIKVLEWIMECFPESSQSIPTRDCEQDEDSFKIVIKISDIINVSISIVFPYIIKVDLLFQNGFDYKENIQTFEEFITAINEIPE